MSLLGNVNKNKTNYLKRIKRKTNHIGHPRNKGIPMQAHHLISEKGIKLSEMGPTLEKLGYDINALKNLIFLPSTLPGACHLGVQLHSGNHTAASTMYDDETGHPLSYHQLVKYLVKKTKISVTDFCLGKPGKTMNEVRRKMNAVSQEILDMVENKPSKAPLTAMATCFERGKSGCGGLQNVPRPVPSTLKPCPKGRNHEGDGGISYKNPLLGVYKLRAGR